MSAVPPAPKFQWGKLQKDIAFRGKKLHGCGICLKNYSSENYLKRHQRTHTASNWKKYSCLICSRKFEFKSLLNVHSLTRHYNQFKEELRCIFCGKGFAFKGVFERHIRSHTLERHYFCRVCPGEFAGKIELRGHLLRHDPSRKKTKECGLCEKQFFTLSELQSHINWHTGEKTHKCQVCRKGFPNAGALRRHMTSHSEVKPHICNICNNRFATNETLKNHLKIHAVHDRVRYPCQLCARAYFSRSDLKKHTWSAHNPNRKREFKCRLCNRKFFTASGLKSHSKTHLGRRRFPCNICSLAFETEEQLRNHKLAPSYVNGHSLLKYRKELRKQNSIVRDSTAVSKGQTLSLNCAFCEKIFTKRSPFESHIKLHTRERPNFCMVCSFETAETGRLRAHLAIHDPNRRKDVECDVCKKQFYDKYALQIHKRIHVSEGGFLCQICGARFKTRNQLNQHNLIHNNNL